MAANMYPVIENVANIGFARPTGANTASDGSTPGGGTAISTLFTPGTNGSFVYRIRVSNSQVTPAASSAMVVRFFITDTGGTNPRLWREYALPAATRSASVIGAYIEIGLPGRGLFLANGQLLKCCQSVYAGVQDLVDFVAEGGNL